MSKNAQMHGTYGLNSVLCHIDTSNTHLRFAAKTPKTPTPLGHRRDDDQEDGSASPPVASL
jgi:hypothetical protein